MRVHAVQQAVYVLLLGSISLALAAGAGACSAERSNGAAPSDEPDAGKLARDGAIVGGGVADAGDAGVTNTDGMPARCAQDGAKPVAGIASVPLTAALNATTSSARVPLDETVQLLGDGLPLTLMPQQLGTAGLRFERDRMFILTDRGFWDISSEGEARWYVTSSVLLLSIRAADLDHDGDQDLLLLTSEVNDAAGMDEHASPLVSRLSAWERTPDGLAERSEVLRLPYVILPFPYEAEDVDGDGDLDVVSYEHGAPVGYIHDGAFGFTRTVLGETAPEYEDKLLAFVHFTDRNRDGSPDLLVATGEALEIRVFVMLGDGAGRFGPRGPAVIVEATLVPHGPYGLGIWFADVTGDGLEDIVTQDAQSADTPILNVFASDDATHIAPATQLEGLGFEFADVDADGATDLVTTRNQRLQVLLSRGDGAFEARDLGISMAPPVMDFAVDPGSNGAPVLHVLYDLSGCPACASGCTGRCLFDACVACLSDADCAHGRCEDQTCVP